MSYDVIIAGAGISGSFIAHALTRAGLRCLCLEAGRRFDRHSYPRKELDASSLLYWSGGIELNEDADLGFLRPKCVGGGSVVNQALVDRFDDIALHGWRQVSGVDFFSTQALAPWYERAEAELSIQTIPAEHRNRNALIFEQGFAKNGYRCAPLRRAQRDCRYEEGNDCIECLSGCRIDSKQSTPITVLHEALSTGLLTLVPETEVVGVVEKSEGVEVRARSTGGVERTHRGKALVLASGAIGNSTLLLRSGFLPRHPALGSGFYTHPQYMHLAIYDEPVRAHEGPFQAFKSDDPGFRERGFKLENVYAPPVGVAMLLPGLGARHADLMKKMPHFACIEVAVRDTEPGLVRAHRDGRPRIRKRLNAEDRRRRDAGLEAMNSVFRATGAREIIPGKVAIGLHLMGGCAMGNDARRSVVTPDFRLHGSRAIYAADSSIFPNAPGINPSLTIMALSLMAAERIAGEVRR